MARTSDSVNRVGRNLLMHAYVDESSRNSDFSIPQLVSKLSEKHGEKIPAVRTCYKILKDKMDILSQEQDTKFLSYGNGYPEDPVELDYIMNLDTLFAELGWRSGLDKFWTKRRLKIALEFRVYFQKNYIDDILMRKTVFKKKEITAFDRQVIGTLHLSIVEIAKFHRLKELIPDEINWSIDRIYKTITNSIDWEWEITDIYNQSLSARYLNTYVPWALGIYTITDKYLVSQLIELQQISSEYHAVDGDIGWYEHELADFDSRQFYDTEDFKEFEQESFDKMCEIRFDSLKVWLKSKPIYEYLQETVKMSGGRVVNPVVQDMLDGADQGFDMASNIGIKGYPLPQSINELEARPDDFVKDIVLKRRSWKSIVMHSEKNV